MKILRAVAFAAVSQLAATVHAATPSAVVTVDTWQAADQHADFPDTTPAWYHTGEVLAGPYRDGAPWAAGQPLSRPAETALAPAPAAAAVPARVDTPPPPVPEPPMASMLLVGAVLILLRVGRKQDLFG